eukprot:1158562-Pelagomonas_calceolata.AAC.12
MQKRCHQPTTKEGHPPPYSLWGADPTLRVGQQMTHCQHLNGSIAQELKALVARGVGARAVGQGLRIIIVRQDDNVQQQYKCASSRIGQYLHTPFTVPFMMHVEHYHMSKHLIKQIQDIQVNINQQRLNANSVYTRAALVWKEHNLPDLNMKQKRNLFQPPVKLFHKPVRCVQEFTINLLTPDHAKYSPDLWSFAFEECTQGGLALELPAAKGWHDGHTLTQKGCAGKRTGEVCSIPRAQGACGGPWYLQIVLAEGLLLLLLLHRKQRLTGRPGRHPMPGTLPPAAPPHCLPHAFLGRSVYAQVIRWF